jgi:hypothetical protein
MEKLLTQPVREGARWMVTIPVLESNGYGARE